MPYIALVIAGVRRFTDRLRTPVALPNWFRPTTALPFGVLVTAADLPNAFPYFIAIERMVTAGIPPAQGLAVIAAYTVIYCVPCLLLLIVGLLSRTRTTALLDRVITRLGTGTVTRSIPIGVFLISAGIAVASVPFWIDRVL